MQLATLYYSSSRAYRLAGMGVFATIFTRGSKLTSGSEPGKVDLHGTQWRIYDKGGFKSKN